MLINKDNIVKIKLPRTFNFEQIVYLDTAHRNNSRFLLTQNFKNYLDQIPKDLLLEYLHCDIKYLKYSGKIRGYRFENAPLSLIKKFMVETKQLPKLVFACVLENEFNKIYKTEDFQRLLAEFNQTIGSEFLSFNNPKSCSILKYNEILLKYKSLDLALFLSLIGVIITDSVSEMELLSSYKEATYTFEEYLQFIEKLIVKNKEFLNYHNEVFSLVSDIYLKNEKIEEYSEFNSILKKTEKILIAKEKIGKIKFEPELIIDEKGFQHQLLQDIKELCGELESSETENRLNLGISLSDIQKLEFSHTSLTTKIKSLTNIDKYFNSVLKSLREQEESFKNKLEEYEFTLKEASDYISKNNIKNILIPVNYQPSNIVIQNLNYPEQFQNELNLSIEKLHTLRVDVEKLLIEKEKILLIERINELEVKSLDLLNKIDNINFDDKRFAFKSLQEVIDILDELKTRNTILPSEEKNNIISLSSNTILIQLDIIKYISSKERFSVLDLNPIIEKLQSIVFTKPIEIGILEKSIELFLSKFEFSQGKLTTSKAILIIIISYLTLINSKSVLGSYLDTLMKNIPYDENPKFRNLIRFIQKGQQFELQDKRNDSLKELEQASNYFIKDGPFYKHYITQRNEYKNIKKTITSSLLPYLEKNYLSLIIQNKDSETKLQKMLNILNDFSVDEKWNELEAPIKFKNLLDYQKKQLIHDFTEIVSVLKTLTTSLIKSSKEFKKVTEFFKDDFADDLNEALKIFDSNLIQYLKNIDYDTVRFDIFELNNDLMQISDFYVYQEESVKLLYESDAVDFDSLIKIYQTNSDKSKDSKNNVANFYLMNKILNKHTLKLFKDNLSAGEYEDAKNKYEDSIKKIKSFETKIEKDFKVKFERVVEAERYKYAENIYEESEKIRQEKIAEVDRYTESKYRILKPRLNELESWISSFSEEQEKFDTLHSIYSEIQKILLSRKKENFTSIELKIELLESAKNKNNLDLEFIKNQINGLDDEPIENGNVEMTLIDLERYLKNPGAITILSLKERITTYLNNTNLDELIAWYKELKNIQIQPQLQLRSFSVNCAKDFFKAFAKIFRLYSEPDVENNCIIIEEPYPFFITKPYVSHTESNPVVNRKMIFTFLNNRKGSFNKNDLDDINGILLNKLGANYEIDAYFVVCFILNGNKKSIRDINKLSDFDSFTIIDPSSLGHLIICNNKPRQALSHFLIRHLPLKSINPFDSNLVVSSLSGIFVGRSELISKIIRDRNSYAIYGARRIGKTSLCRELSNRFEKNGQTVCFESVSSQTFDNDFDEGLTIAKAILYNLFNSKREIFSFEDFKEEFSKQITINPNKRYVIILDEFDRFIKNTDNFHAERGTVNRFIFIKALKDLKIKYQQNLKIILSGFIYLYSVVKDNIAGIEKAEDPWKGFVTPKQISVLNSDEAIELVKKVQEELALQFEDPKLINYILKNTSYHPAIIQEFCKILVDSISRKVNNINRKIFREDIDRVLYESISDNFYEVSEDMPFIKYVHSTSKLNLKGLALSIVTIFAINDLDEISLEHLGADLKTWGLEFTGNQFNKAIQSLVITDIIRENSATGTIKFYNSFWKEYLNKYLNYNYFEFESILKEAKEDLEEYA